MCASTHPVEECKVHDSDKPVYVCIQECSWVFNGYAGQVYGAHGRTAGLYAKISNIGDASPSKQRNLLTSIPTIAWSILALVPWHRVLVEHMRLLYHACNNSAVWDANCLSNDQWAAIIEWASHSLPYLGFPRSPA